LYFLPSHASDVKKAAVKKSSSSAAFIRVF
jgi:hypothetical protein